MGTVATDLRIGQAIAEVAGLNGRVLVHKLSTAEVLEAHRAAADDAVAFGAEIALRAARWSDGGRVFGSMMEVQDADWQVVKAISVAAIRLNGLDEDGSAAPGN